MVFVFFYEPSILLLLFCSCYDFARSCYDFALAMFVYFEFVALMSHLLRSRSFSCSVYLHPPHYATIVLVRLAFDLLGLIPDGSNRSILGFAHAYGRCHMDLSEISHDDIIFCIEKTWLEWIAYTVMAKLSCAGQLRRNPFLRRCTVCPCQYLLDVVISTRDSCGGLILEPLV